MTTTKPTPQPRCPWCTLMGTRCDPDHIKSIKEARS